MHSARIGEKMNNNNITHKLSKLVNHLSLQHSLDKENNFSTMTANANIDYVTTCFEFPTLTKVNGTPDYESLQKIKMSLKQMLHLFCAI